MYSLKQIVSMNSDATKKAEREKIDLFIAECDGDVNVKKCPWVGEYIPEGWELVNTYFVESSDFGSENEPALTFGQFLTKVRKGFGYGIGEVGQFQLYIHEYKKC